MASKAVKYNTTSIDEMGRISVMPSGYVRVLRGLLGLMGQSLRVFSFSSFDCFDKQ